MSKKRTGLLIAFGAALGAAAAGISYYLKYRSFNDELEKDFHDYEEDEPSKEEEADTFCDASDPVVTERSYITLDPGKHRSENNAEASSAVVEEDMDGVNP